MKIVATVTIEFWPEHEFDEAALKDEIAWAAQSAVMDTTGSRTASGDCAVAKAEVRS